MTWPVPFVSTSDCTGKTASSETDSEPVVRDSTGATETPYALQLRSIPMKNSSSRMRRALIQNARSFVSFAVTKRSSSTPLPDTSRRSVYTRKKSESGA